MSDKFGELANSPDADLCVDCDGSGMALTGVEYMGACEVGGCQGCAGTGASNFWLLDLPAEEAR